ncbi:MAG: hypothetical protein WC623_18830 [Pedobacter sp.]|uniref:hypothetical protein n=1 Tax=Pedobacter sp. TaxID=1411316 RepID=UPI00356789EA
MLSNKKVLFIGPVFHDYHILIKENLIALGAEVTFYPERKYGNIFKIINNFFNKSLKTYQNHHYNQVFEKFDVSSFDYLFVIRGFMLSKEFLVKFRDRSPKAIMIMYQWDSNKTNCFSHLIPLFDKVYSFDFADCKQHLSLSYLPLFFTDDVSRNARSNVEHKKYDFFFMGWFFPERYEAVLKFIEFSSKNGFSVKAFLYMPFTSYIKERLLGRKLNREIVSLKPMPRREYLNILVNSKIMVDVSSPNQTGLSMRVIEAMASNTKILTNNHNIKNDTQIYSKEYVAFFNELNPEINESFLLSEVSNKPNLLSLQKWLVNIFSVD